METKIIYFAKYIKYLNAYLIKVFASNCSILKKEITTKTKNVFLSIRKEKYDSLSQIVVF